MDRPDDPEGKKKTKVVKIRTTDKRLKKVEDIYKKGKVRSIAHDPDLYLKFEGARARGTPTKKDDGYKEYGRIRRNLSKDKEFKGKQIHHIDFPRKNFSKKLSTDTTRLLLTDEKTHKDLHRATGGKDWDMYREKKFANHRKKSVRDTINDNFNFMNPRSHVKAGDVMKKLEEFNKRQQQQEQQKQQKRQKMKKPKT